VDTLNISGMGGRAEREWLGQDRGSVGVGVVRVHGVRDCVIA
jgi:hypothetical protein